MGKRPHYHKARDFGEQQRFGCRPCEWGSEGDHAPYCSGAELPVYRFNRTQRTASSAAASINTAKQSQASGLKVTRTSAGVHSLCLHSLTLPPSWLRLQRTVFDVIQWYAVQSSTHLVLTDEVKRGWVVFANLMNDQKEKDTLQRDVTLYAFGREDWQQRRRDGITLPFIDVDCLGITPCTSALFNDVNKVTGFDYRVQGFIAGQRATVKVLRITNEDLREFVFVCCNGIHGSLGCCILLAIFVFPRARVALTTNEIVNAALTLGLRVRLPSLSV